MNRKKLEKKLRRICDDLLSGSEREFEENIILYIRVMKECLYEAFPQDTVPQIKAYFNERALDADEDIRLKWKYGDLWT